MTNRTLLPLLAALLCTFSLVSCGGEAKKETTEQAQAAAAPASSSTLSADVVQAYLDLKDAFVESSVEKTKAAATNFSSKVKNNEVATAQAGIISTTDDLDAQRAAFETLSIAFYEQLQVEGAGKTLYKQYCPMAFDDKGAFWISDVKEIRNPYFGDMMLKCGSVEETIAANE